MASNKQILPSPDFLRISQEKPATNKCFLTPCGMNLDLRRNNGSIEDKILKRPSRGMCKLRNTKEYIKDYKNHKKSSQQNKTSDQSIQCPVDECSFRGVRQTVEQHVRTQHKTEVYDRIKKLSTPEEIAAWREERRKRFPTAANRILKEKALEQRRERGEVLDLPRQRCSTRLNNEQIKTSNETITNNSPVQSVKETSVKNNLPSVLGNLLLSYASDNESEEEIVELPSKTKSNIIEESSNNISNMKSTQDNIVPVLNLANKDNLNDPPEEIVISHKPLQRQVKQRNPVMNPKNDPFFQGRGRRFKKPNTLLAKLLEPHIRHERNVLLQCVRYVCSTNFLGTLDNTSEHT